ncbi:unnamed protein product, partial [Ectocarpus sp. 13 AM-2016]
IPNPPPPFFWQRVPEKQSEQQFQAFLSRNCRIHHDDHEEGVDSRAGCCSGCVETDLCPATTTHNSCRVLVIASVQEEGRDKLGVQQV